MCLAIMACAVCRKKVLMRNPLNVLGGNLGDLGEFCKGLNMPVKVLGRAYYDILGITDQNTLAEFWNHPTPPDKELFHAYRMYHLNVTQINGNFYSQVFFLNKNSSDSSTPAI